VRLLAWFQHRGYLTWLLLAVLPAVPVLALRASGAIGDPPRIPLNDLNLDTSAWPQGTPAPRKPKHRRHRHHKHHRRLHKHR